MRGRRSWSSFSLEILEDRPGFARIGITGRGAKRLFEAESGGHRWQRVPRNDKRGRVHTSTITVAVFSESPAAETAIDPDDIDETFTGGGGKGGQHQNKRSTAVVLVHKPTGIRVRIEGRSQHQNRLTAMAVLVARVTARASASSSRATNKLRRELVGTGMRGDKVRTISVPNDIVFDHQTGKKTSYRRYRRGHLRDLG